MTRRSKKRKTSTATQRQSAPNKPQAAKPAASTTLPGQPPPGSDIASQPPPIRAELALIQRQQKSLERTPQTKREKMRETVAAIVAMQIQGMTTNEIAEALGIKPASVRQYKYIAGKEGWLHTDDPLEKTHHELIHRAVSNLEELLHSRDARTGLPDKEVTLEALKGMQVFGGGPAHQNEHQATNILAIQITMPTGGNLPQMREGNAGGVPAYIEGEVVRQQD